MKTTSLVPIAIPLIIVSVVAPSARYSPRPASPAFPPHPAVVSQWRVVESPTTSNLYSVDVAPYIMTYEAEAVGAGGVGLRWLNPWAVDNLETTNHLRAVDFRSGSDTWAVGDNGTILHRTWSAWAPCATPTVNRLNDVWVKNGSLSAAGWAVGQHGIILQHNSTTGMWTASTETGFDLSSVEMLSGTFAVAVGGSTVTSKIYQWNGTSWGEWYSGDEGQLNGLDMLSTTEGWAVGGAQKAILRLDDGVWEEFGSATRERLYAVEMISSTDGWAVGGGASGGLILRWDGASWTEVQSPTANTLYSVAMVSATEGWAVGSAGTILYYGPVNEVYLPAILR